MSNQPDAYALWCRPEDFNLPQLCGIALSLEDANAWKAESEAESANSRIAVTYFWTKSEVYRPTESRPGPRRP